MSQTPHAHDAPPRAGCGCSDGNGRHGPDPQETFRKVSGQVAQLKEFASYYVTARLDRAKVSVRKAGILAAVGAMGLIALVAFICAAVVLTLLGLTYAFAAIFGGTYWAGALLVGAGSLALLALATWLGIRSIHKSSREQTVNRYEERQDRQQRQLGRNVEQAAAQRHD